MTYGIKTTEAKIISLIFLVVLFCFLFSLPIFVLAQTFSTGGTGIVYVCKEGVTYQEGNCTFNDVIIAIKNLVDWATTFALGLSIVVIIYAGFLYMTSGANPGNRRRASEMLLKVAIGIAVVISAWLIVKLITDTLLGQGFNTFLD